MGNIKFSEREIEDNIKGIVASLAFEGLIVTEEEKERARKIFRGEATSQQLVDEVLTRLAG